MFANNKKIWKPNRTKGHMHDIHNKTSIHFFLYHFWTSFGHLDFFYKQIYFACIKPSLCTTSPFVCFKIQCIRSWCQITFRLHVVAHKNVDRLSSKWPPFRHFGICTNKSWMHQPLVVCCFTSTYQLMISNDLLVTRCNIQRCR